MARTIEFSVGNTYADRHETLREQLGDDYDAIMREVVEDKLHELTKNVERRVDAQMAAATQSMADELDDDDD